MHYEEGPGGLSQREKRISVRMLEPGFRSDKQVKGTRALCDAGPHPLPSLTQVERDWSPPHIVGHLGFYRARTDVYQFVSIYLHVYRVPLPTCQQDGVIRAEAAGNDKRTYLHAVITAPPRF